MALEVTSKKFGLNGKDFLKGLFMAVGSSVLMAVQQSLDADAIVWKWKPICMAGFAGGVSYLLKNYFQPAQVKHDITKEQVEFLEKQANTKEASK